MRLPSAWADATEDEPDAWTNQADEGIEKFSRWGYDGLETKRVRICGLEVNDDPDEEDARPEANRRPMTEVVSSSKPAKPAEITKEIELCKESWQVASEHEVARLQEGRGGQVASGGPRLQGHRRHGHG